MDQDLELGDLPDPSALDPLDHIVIGYPRLGKRMGSIPETAMYRKFGAINAQILPHMQAEITAWERDLRECELSDSQIIGGNRNKNVLSWYYLQASATSDDYEEKKQYTILEQLRKRTKEYSKTSQFAVLQRTMSDLL